MKIKYAVLVIVLFILSLSSLNAQKIANKQFSLLSYDLAISNDLAEELKDLDSYVKSIKVYNTPESDKLKAVFIHNLFYTITDELKHDLSIEILPVNTFLNKVKYDIYGYPQTSIQQAMRKGNSAYYFKLQVKLESNTKKLSQEKPDLFKDLTYKTIVPVVTINITVYSKQGVLPVDTWNGTYTTEIPLEINEYLLLGFDNKDIESPTDEANPLNNFYYILHKAIDNLIQDYYTN
ncbi:MAG: hypothetical protein AB7S50_07095 [Bacteroidales bacterium]